MSLIRELQQRNVLRVGAAYLALSWLLIQVIDTLGPEFGLPDGSLRIASIILAIAFVPVMAMTWAFEWTAEGIKRDKEVDRGSTSRASAARRLDRVIILLLAVATSYFAYDKFVGPGQPQESDEQSIAVLPFEDMSQAGDQDWFADGISEELLNLLAKVDGLRVTARTSSFAFRDQGLGIPEIAAQLGVRYVLEGSVRKAGDTIRITAQLIEAGSDIHVWSETYDRRFDNVFAIQDEISATVVDELKVTILGELPTADITSEAAYELYLEGLPLLAARSDEGLVRAEEIFRQVIALDAEYAPAHASYALSLFWQSTGIPDEKIAAAAQRALDIDPDNADALALLGRKYVDMRRIFEGEALLRRAVEINPSHANAWRWLGTLHTDTDPGAYLRYTRRAFELNPRELTIGYHTGLALALQGRTDEALREFARMSDGEVGILGLSMASQAQLMAGRFDLALKAHFRLYRDRQHLQNNVRLLLYMDEPDLADIWAETGRSIPQIPAVNIAMMNTYQRLSLGDREGAIRTLNDAIAGDLFDPSVPTLGAILVEIGGEPALAVTEFERNLLESQRYAADYRRHRWRDFFHYGVALYRTGDKSFADAIFADIVPVMEGLIEQGMYVDQYAMRLHEMLSGLYATQGQYDKAIEVLNDGLTASWLCVPCLRHGSYFQPMQDMPEFQSVLARAVAFATEQRDRLAAEGMLLTPEEVLALETFDHDPFGP